MATVVTRYVNTASSGGDGTTNNTSGSDAAYASLSAALTDIASDFPDFVSSDVQVDVLCTGSAADTTSPGSTLPTITTDATRFLRIKAQAADKASLAGWSTSKYRLSTTTTNTVNIENLRHLRLEDLQIENANTASGTCQILRVAPGASIASEIIILNCRLRKGGTFSTTGHFGINFVSSTAPSLLIAVNVLIEGLTTASCVGFRNQIGNPARAYNTLVVNAPIGFTSITSNQGYLKNCRAYNCTDGYSGTWNAASTNNASDLASDAPGSNPKNSIGNNFTDAGSGDYRYASGDGAIDQGADLSADAAWPFAVDMEGTSRPQDSVWDIGPFEFVSGGGGGSIAAKVAFYKMLRNA